MFSNIFNKKKYRHGIIALIWIYAFALILPTNMRIFDEFGFDCRSGTCDFIANKNGVSPQNADLILNSIAFILTSAIILLSYSYILFYIWHKHKYLKKYGTRYSKYKNFGKVPFNGKARG